MDRLSLSEHVHELFNPAGARVGAPSGPWAFQAPVGHYLRVHVPSDPVLPPGLEEVKVLGLDNGAEHEGQHIRGSLLARSTAEGVHLSDCLVEDTELTGVEWPEARLTRVIFRRCELSGSLLSELSAADVLFDDCRLSGLVLTDGRLRRVQFRDCKAEGSNFRFTKTEKAVFLNSDLAGSDFQGCQLKGAIFQACNLSGAEFWKASTEEAVFAACTLVDLQGVSGLNGAHIGADQVFAVSQRLLGELGIATDADDLL